MEYSFKIMIELGFGRRIAKNRDSKWILVDLLILRIFNKIFMV